MYEAIKPSEQFLASLNHSERNWFENGGGIRTPAGIMTKNGLEAAAVNSGTEPPIVDPKQGFADKKLGVQWVPPALIISAARAFTEGRMKYGPFKWREARSEAMTYVGAIMRHLLAYIDGEDIDPESPTGKRHLDGIVASLGILLDVTDMGLLVDNRPKKGPAPKLLSTGIAVK